MTPDALPPPGDRPFWKNERVLGALFLLGGASVGWHAVYRPLAAAAAGAPEVGLSMRGALIVPLALGMGVYFLLVGPGAEQRLRPEHGTLSPLGWVLTLGLGLAGGGLYFWLQARLESLGYAFG